MVAPGLLNLSGRGWATAVALTVSVWLLAVAPAAESHVVAAARSSGKLKLDRTEVAVLGIDHAREHARERLLERAARGRWNRLAPRERRARLQAAARSEQRLDRQLAVEPRDAIGVWSADAQGNPIPLPTYAIHAIVLPTGNLLILGRQPLRADGTRLNLGAASIFDPTTGLSHSIETPPIPENGGQPASVYCSGHALLSDGRVLLVGGTLSEEDPAHGKQFAGLKYTFIFDPWTETWQIGPQMSAGRWYPTAVKLASGDVLIASGLDENAQGVLNPQMDLFRPGIDDTATALTPFPGGYRGPDPRAPFDAQHDLSVFPRMFTLPDGNVALAGPLQVDSAILDTATATDPAAALGSAWTQLPTSPSVPHYGGPAVLEPQMGNFGGSWRVLLMGGIPAEPGMQLANKVVERLDADPAGVVGWLPPNPAESLNAARFWPNNVLLPDGGMVVVGGGAGIDPGTVANYYLGDPAPQELRQVELRKPGETTWQLGAAQEEWRTYHSTASLLPDGRVFSGGDDFHEGPDPALPLPDSVRRDDAEIYWPPYLFNDDRCAPRPAIRAVGATQPPADPNAPWAVLAYGETFGIFTEHAEPGMQVTLVAPSAVTHSFDMGQRVVPLRITSTVTGGGLNARIPANAAVAPPGWYMLFVIAADGTPSISRWVRVLPAAMAAAARGGVVPATVSGAWPDPQPRTCVDPVVKPAAPGPLPAAEPAPSPLGFPAPPPGTPARRRSTVQIAVDRAKITPRTRTLDVIARIGWRTSGTVGVELVAGGRRTRLRAPIGGHGGRVHLVRRIPASQARLGGGILTIRYAGDADTFAQTVRVRAARHSAQLKAVRPTLSAAGRIVARGTISRRARGVVHLELRFRDAAQPRAVRLRAKIADGAWRLDERLPAPTRAAIAARVGPLQAAVLFTGDGGAGVAGEVRTFQLLGDR